MKLKQLAANMTELEMGDITVLFSYKTPVAYHQAGAGYFKTNKKWGNTTSRHISKWLGINGFSGNLDTILEVNQEVLDNLVK